MGVTLVLQGLRMQGGSAHTEHSHTYFPLTPSIRSPAAFRQAHRTLPHLFSLAPPPFSPPQCSGRHVLPAGTEEVLGRGNPRHQNVGCYSTIRRRSGPRQGGHQQILTRHYKGHRRQGGLYSLSQGYRGLSSIYCRLLLYHSAAGTEEVLDRQRGTNSLGGGQALPSFG